MIDNNINLFATFFPCNYNLIKKNFLSKNNSPTYISKVSFEKMNNYKKTKNDNLSFAFCKSGKFNNVNNLNNSNNSLLSVNKKLLLRNKKEKIPLLKTNINRFDFKHNINKNFSSYDININKKIILNLNKNIFDQNYLDKNNIIFNKKRNYFSKESINLLKYLNYKNLYSNYNFNKMSNKSNEFSDRNMKKLNNSNENQKRNNNPEKLNSYLTVYNFKSSIHQNQTIQKSKSKINNLMKRNLIGLPKMHERNPKNLQNKFNTIYLQEKTNIQTFFPNSRNELFSQKTLFNQTKLLGNTLLKQFKKKNKNNKKLLIEILSIPGKTFNKEKINQDSYMVLPNNILSENDISKFSGLKVFGIFDGHGEFGDIISNEVKNYFIEYFNQLNYNSNDIYEKLCKDNYKEIYSLFNQIDKKLHIKYNSKNTCQNSGTTANLILLFKNKIVSINIGDSKSILVSGNNNNIIQLNKCHNPERDEEKKRIEKNGGEVGRVNWADYGPQRVWYKGRIYPGLSISRSFGDFISEPLGVFSTPEIEEFDIDYKKEKIIVLATDGIWEFLSNEKVRDIIIPYYNENNICGCINKLIETASKIWDIKNPNYIDDLSVILLFFK